MYITKQIFINQFIFLFLVCVPINGMDASKQLVLLDGWVTLPKDLADKITEYAGLVASYRLSETCSQYRTMINKDGCLLKKYPDVVKRMNINTYTKAMIYYARVENKDMFFWLKNNTEQRNRSETQKIFDYISGPDIADKKEKKLALYKSSEYVAEEIQKFIGWSDDLSPYIRLLVHQGFDVNHQWLGGKTLLHFLVHGRNGWGGQRSTMIAFLFAQPGININMQDSSGKTPLHKVLYDIRKKEGRRGSLSDDQRKRTIEQCAHMDQLLNDARTLINVQDEKGNTALHTAVIYQNNKQIEVLIKRPGIIFTLHNNDGNTVLHFSEFYTHISTIKDIVVNVNAQNKEGNTPLHLAEQFKQYDYLLKAHDINVNSKNKKGETPLHYSIKHPRYECVAHPYYDTATIGHCWDQAKALLEDQRIDITITTNTGKRPVHYAAKYYTAQYGGEVLKILVETLDADLHSVDSQGRTALHIASRYGNNEGVEYLLQKMSPDIINTYDKNGYSALDYANKELNKNKKEKWGFRGPFYLSRRDKKETLKLFFASDKVYIPFLYPYRRIMLYGFLTGLVGLTGILVYFFFPFKGPDGLNQDIIV